MMWRISPMHFYLWQRSDSILLGVLLLSLPVVAWLITSQSGIMISYSHARVFMGRSGITVRIYADKMPTVRPRCEWVPAGQSRWLPMLLGKRTVSQRQSWGTIYIPYWCFIIFSLGLLVYLWRVRKKFGVGHCTNCSYDLRGNLSGVCPECGTAIEPKQLTRLAGVNSVSTNPVNHRSANDK